MSAFFRWQDISAPIRVAALLLLATLPQCAIAVRTVRADDAQSRQTSVSEKLAAAEDWYQAASVAWDAGVIRFTQLQEASLAWKEAALDAATTKQARIKALQAHLDRLLALEKRVAGLNWGFLGPANGEEFMYNFWVAEAKVWVAEERAENDMASEPTIYDPLPLKFSLSTQDCFSKEIPRAITRWKAAHSAASADTAIG